MLNREACRLRQRKSNEKRYGVSLVHHASDILRELITEWCSEIEKDFPGFLIPYPAPYTSFVRCVSEARPIDVQRLELLAGIPNLYGSTLRPLGMEVRADGVLRLQCAYAPIKNLDSVAAFYAINGLHIHKRDGFVQRPWITAGLINCDAFDDKALQLLEQRIENTPFPSYKEPIEQLSVASYNNITLRDCSEICTLPLRLRRGESLKVFIGSSSESLPHAKKIADIVTSLRHEAVLWNSPQIFRPGKAHIEDLEEICAASDASIFVFNEDDTSVIRDEERPTVRANVLFEYGLFMGRMSRERVCIACVGRPTFANDIGDIGRINVDWEHEEDLIRELHAFIQQVECIEVKPIVQKQSATDSMDTCIAEATESLFFSCVSLSTLWHKKKALIARGKEIAIRLLITDLQDESLQAHYSDLRSNKAQDDPTELLTELQKCRNIEIRSANFLMPSVYVASDIAAPYGKIKASHALCDTASEERPNVVVTPKHGFWYETYKTQIELMWAKAKLWVPES